MILVLACTAALESAVVVQKLVAVAQMGRKPVAEVVAKTLVVVVVVAAAAVVLMALAPNFPLEATQLSIPT